MDGRPLAIGQAAGFHSCGQVHRDLSAAPPRDRRADRDEWQRFERRYVSTREVGIVHTSGMRERRAAILGDRCSLGPECCGSHSLPTSSDAVFRYGAACSVRHGLASRDPCEGTAPNVAKDVVRVHWRNKAVSCSEAPSNTSNSSVQSDSSSFPARHRIVAGLKGAKGSASVQQLYQKRSHHLLLRVGGRDSLQDCGGSKGIDILSDSIECNYPSRNTSSLLYSKNC